MITIKKKYYICEMCGKTSQNANEIEACRNSHRSIDDVSMQVDYMVRSEYQDSIDLIWPDGAIATYALERIQAASAT